MALSQKHCGKILVPWYNSHEWKHVYSLIYSETSAKPHKQKALKILQIWKIRMPILFAGVEGTIIILNAMLQDDNVFSKEELSYFYGLAIMRFLNLCAAHSDQQGTFYRVAKEKKLPEWLVNIRHDLAHSQKHLSLFMLRRGIEYCFEWLRREYWEMQNREITDFIITEPTKEKVDEKINLYCKYVVSMIAGEKLDCSVLNMLKELKANKNSSSSTILRKLLRGNKLTTENIPEIIIEGGYFSIPESDGLESIPVAYAKGWKPLLQYLQENNVLTRLIQKLHDNCMQNKDCHIQNISSLWLKQIFDALVNTRVRGDNFASKNDEFENDLPYAMTLLEPSDGFIMELKDFCDVVLQNPHPFLRNYVPSLMTLCSYKNDVVRDIDNVLFQYFNTNMKLSSAYTPMTIENVKNIVEVDILEDLNAIPEKETKPASSGSRWMKIEDTSIYEGCPIGILPHQYRNYNPTIHF